MKSLNLYVLPGTFAVSRLAADSPVPAWASGGPLVSITRTPDELSIVCAADDVPAEVTDCERPWRCLRVAGQIDFSVVGVVASLVDPLAEAGIPVFVLSTFHTDYLLIKAEDFESSVMTLRRVGHHFDDTTRV